MQFTRRTKRVILGFLTLTLFVTLFVLGAFRMLSAAREQQRYQQERAALQAPAPNIAEVEIRSMPQLRRFAGQLQPWMRADVPAEVAGRVVEVMVEAGQQVDKGQPLVRLDDRMARISLESARAKYEEEKRLLEEARRLVKSRAISETALRAQEAAFRIAEVALAETGEILTRHTVRAPLHGIVNRRLVDVGDAVNLNQPVAEVVDLDRLRVEFFVSENDLAAFPQGKKIELLLPSRPAETFHPEVEFVSRSADPGTRLFRVEATLDNPDGKLPGGLQGIIHTAVNQFADCPFVPAAAVRFAGRRSVVMKEDDAGTFEEVEITVGPEIDGFYPVLGGLVAGDRVLIR